jgi:hypothetical protein
MPKNIGNDEKTRRFLTSNLSRPFSHLKYLRLTRHAKIWGGNCSGCLRTLYMRMLSGRPPSLVPFLNRNLIQNPKINFHQYCVRMSLIPPKNFWARQIGKPRSAEINFVFFRPFSLEVIFAPIIHHCHTRMSSTTPIKEEVLAS